MAEPNPMRLQMPPTCKNTPEGGEHLWMPIALMVEAYGRPNPTGANLYLVCTKCFQHTYVVSEFVGFYYNEPPPLVDAFRPPVPTALAPR